VAAVVDDAAPIHAAVAATPADHVAAAVDVVAPEWLASAPPVAESVLAVVAVAAPDHVAVALPVATLTKSSSKIPPATSWSNHAVATRSGSKTASPTSDRADPL
jgi:hypothetical protein